MSQKSRKARKSRKQNRGRFRTTPALRRAGFLLAVALFLLSTARPASATIQYRVSLANPDQHLFQVTMTVPVEGRQLVVALPAWNALYQIRDFALRIRASTACVRRPSPRLSKFDMLDKQTWRVRSPARASRATITAFRFAIPSGGTMPGLSIRSSTLTTPS